MCLCCYPIQAFLSEAASFSEGRFCKERQQDARLLFYSEKKNRMSNFFYICNSFITRKMITLSFFNEKGGTGKTTLTAMFASWLAYRKHETVYVIDYDFPSYQMYEMRMNDMRIIKENPDSPYSRECQKNMPFRIGKAVKKDSYTINDLHYIAQSLKKQTRGDGYFLLDFPGRYLPSDPVCFLSQLGLIDFFVFPIDSDRQSRAAALNCYMDMQQRCVATTGHGQAGAFLWNRENITERRGGKDWYEGPERTFKMFGIPVIEGRVREMLSARRDADTFGFIRNTLCWPEKNINIRCPYLEPLFENIKQMADNYTNFQAAEILKKIKK